MTTTTAHTFLYLPQSRTWILNVVRHGLFVFLFSELRWEVIVRFVDIGGIVDHYCLNFFSDYHKIKYNLK